MDRAEIAEKVIAILRDQKTLPDDPIDTARPLTELGFDSLDAINVLFEVEETFGISVADDEARAIKTADDMIATIEKLLAASST
jgi:acyl carrier protein